MKFDNQYGSHLVKFGELIQLLFAENTKLI